MPARRSADPRLARGPSATVGAACASDAFFPFPDAIEACLVAGVRAFAQPGGSTRDDEIEAACREYGIALVHTKLRLFHH